MPKNSSGVYSQPAGTAAVSGATIGSSAFNTLISDISTVLTGDVPRAGGVPMLGDLPMGGNNITGLDSAAARTDAPNAGQVTDGGLDWYGDGSGTNAKVITTNGFAPSAYVQGFRVRFRNVTANTGAATANVAAIGVADIEGPGGAALVGGEMLAGQFVTLEYDTNFNSFILLNPANLFTSLLQDTSPQLGGFLDTNSFQVQGSRGTNIASATTPTVPTDGNHFNITGTTTITGFSDVKDGLVCTFRFAGSLTLTHGSTLALPGEADIVTATNDIMIAVQDTSTLWRVVSYQKALPGAFSLAGLIPIREETITNQATMDIALPTGFDSFEIELTGVIPIVDNRFLWARFRRTGQGSVDSGGSDYATIFGFIQSNGTQLNGGSNESIAQMALTPTSPKLDLLADLTGLFKVFQPNNAALETKLHGEIIYDSNASVYVAGSTKSIHKFDSTVDQLTFLMETGNITGSYRLWGRAPF